MATAFSGGCGRKGMGLNMPVIVGVYFLGLCMRAHYLHMLLRAPSRHGRLAALQVFGEARFWCCACVLCVPISVGL